MVHLDRDNFEQVTMLLVNLTIRALKNLDQIKIQISKKGHCLTVHVIYFTTDSKPQVLLLQPEGNKITQ